MSSKPDSARKTPAKRGPNAREVADYLRQHPDFLVDRPDLLAVLTPPSEASGKTVVDFQNFMIGRLRRDRDALRDTQGTLLETARHNLQVQGRVHRAVLHLLEAQTLEEVIQILSGDLALLLDVDVVGLVIESNGTDTPQVHRSGVRIVEPDIVDAFLGDRPVRLDADITGDAVLFGGMAGLVRSQALIRLDVSPHTPPGLLALGSRTVGSFEDHQGTELLRFLGGVVERCIRAWLAL